MYQNSELSKAISTASSVEGLNNLRHHIEMAISYHTRNSDNKQVSFFSEALEHANNLLSQADTKERKKELKVLLEKMGFKCTKVCYKTRNNNQVFTIHIPTSENGEWNSHYRERLNQLCMCLHSLGFASATKTLDSNSLIDTNASGAPWMLFNGGETISVAMP